MAVSWVSSNGRKETIANLWMMSALICLITGGSTRAWFGIRRAVKGIQRPASQATFLVAPTTPLRKEEAERGRPGRVSHLIQKVDHRGFDPHIVLSPSSPFLPLITSLPSPFQIELFLWIPAVVVVVVVVAIAVDVAGIAVDVAVVAIAVAVALNAVAAQVEEALQVAAHLLVVVLVVVLLVVVPLEAGHPQLAPQLNVVHSLLVRMFKPSASHVQGMGPLAEWSKYSLITSLQNLIRALYIIMTVRDTLPSWKDVSDMSSGYSVFM
jgi:hypothetical protein